MCAGVQLLITSYCGVLLEKTAVLGLSGSTRRFLQTSGSVRYSKEHTTDPYSESADFNPRPSYFFKIYFNIIFPSTPLFQAVSFCQSFQTKFCMHLHACNTPHPSHVAWFYRHIDMLSTVQITQLLVLRFAAASCHLLTFRSGYFLDSLCNILLTVAKQLPARTLRAFHLKAHNKSSALCCART
jgi:hypothetical protein